MVAVGGKVSGSDLATSYPSYLQIIGSQKLRSWAATTVRTCDPPHEVRAGLQKSVGPIVSLRIKHWLQHTARSMPTVKAVDLPVSALSLLCSFSVKLSVFSMA